MSIGRDGEELAFVDLEIKDPLGGQDLVQSINTTGVAQIDGLGVDPTIHEPVDPAARDMSGEHPNGADSASSEYRCELIEAMPALSVGEHDRAELDP